MFVDQAVIRSGIFCLTLFVICEFAHAQNLESLSTLSDNVELGESRVPQRAPDLANLPKTENVFWHDYSTQGQVGGCNSCGCGPECAQGCAECVSGGKSKCSCRRSRRQQRKPPALGFAVEEVQYGANAGYPSYGFVSHGPWYNGPTTGPGRGKLAALKSTLTKCFSKRRSSRPPYSSGCCICSD